MDRKKLRVAIIGCGCIHRMHATPASMLPQSELACVCDINEEKAIRAGTYYGVPYYTDYTEMIAAEALDVVHICTPHYLHTVIAQYALTHGVNVLSEKPMGLSYDEARKTVELGEAKGLQYGVIFQCRYNDASVFVKKHLCNGSLGRIISARATLTWCRSNSYYSETDWKGTLDKEGGGVIIDQAIHTLDLMHWLIDSELKSVDVRISNHNHSGIQVEDAAEGFMQYKNGTKAMFWATTNYGWDEPIEIRLYCENGTVTMTYDDAIIRFNNQSVITISQKNADIDDAMGNKQCWGLCHKVQIENFYDSILAGKSPDLSGREILKTQYLIDMIYKSARSGQKIEFDV